MIDGWGISCEIALIWMSMDFTDDQLTLVQVMAWCRQATSHYLSQCWLSSLSPYGVTRPQWVKTHQIPKLKCFSSRLAVVFAVYWSQVLSGEWRCSWSSANRRCSNYIWVINKCIAYYGATYIRGFRIDTFFTQSCKWFDKVLNWKDQHALDKHDKGSMVCFMCWIIWKTYRWLRSRLQ